MSEACTTYGIGPDKYADELQALRDERDRLRDELDVYRQAIQYVFEAITKFEDLQRKKVALTPAGQRWTRSKPTEPGWYWWRHYLLTEPRIVRLVIENGIY